MNLANRIPGTHLKPPSITIRLRQISIRASGRGPGHEPRFVTRFTASSFGFASRSSNQVMNFWVGDLVDDMLQLSRHVQTEAGRGLLGWRPGRGPG